MISPRLRIIGPSPRKTLHFQLRRRKPLTLAVGFNCTDGILICADQKHTNGVSQFHANKIFEVNGKDVQVLVALSGHIDYGKMVIDLLRMNPDLYTDLSRIKFSLDAAVKRVFVDRISSVFKAGDPTRPQLEAIVGVTACKSDPKFRPILWKVADTSVSEIAGFDAVGTGQDIARLYLKWLYPMWDIRVPVHVAATLASHIEILAETFDPDCGLGFTSRSQGGNPSLPPASHFGGFAHKEFRDFMYALRQVFLGCMDHECVGEAFEAKVQEFSRAAMRSKTEDERIIQEWVASRPKLSASRSSKGRR